MIVLSFLVSQVGLGKTQRTVQQLLGAPGGRPLPTSAACPSSSDVREPSKGLRLMGTASGTETLFTVPHSTSSVQRSLPPRAGCWHRGTRRPQLWCSGTGQSTRRTCWAITWTAVWWGPMCGSRATTSPLATTGAGAPDPPYGKDTHQLGATRPSE